jgi:hypothetical protein
MNMKKTDLADEKKHKAKIEADRLAIKKAHQEKYGGLTKKEQLEVHLLEQRHQQHKRESAEEERVRRIEASGEQSPILYAIRHITEKCAMNEGKFEFRVTIGDLCLPRPDDLWEYFTNAANLFEQMQQFGCFSEVIAGSKRLDYHSPEIGPFFGPDSPFSIRGGNTQKMREFYLRKEKELGYNSSPPASLAAATQSKLHLVMYTDNYLLREGMTKRDDYYLFRQRNMPSKRRQIIEIMATNNEKRLSAPTISKLVHSDPKTINKELTAMSESIAKKFGVTATEILDSDDNGYRLACEITMSDQLAP